MTSSRVILAIAFLFAMASPSAAATVTLGETSYRSFDWNKPNDVTNIVTGDLPGISVTVSTINIINPNRNRRAIDLYEANPEFDSPDYSLLDDGRIWNFRFAAGIPGETTLQFDSGVGSALLFFGLPDTPVPGPSGFNLAEWDFTDDYLLTIVDGSGLKIDVGNVIDVEDAVISSGHGIVRVERTDGTNLDYISFRQSTTGGNDALDFGLAINYVPEPSSGIFLTAVAALVGLKRKSNKRRSISSGSTPVKPGYFGRICG